MIPGLVSRLSERVVSLTNTLQLLSDIVRVNSTTTTTVLATVTSPVVSGRAGSVFWLVNSSGAAITAVTTGNIATTCSIPNGCVATFVYSPSSLKWHVEKTL